MRVEAVRTPVTKEAFARALVCGWWSLLQTPPPEIAIRILACQSILETGWWKKMICFNVGNEKSYQTAGDWYFVACTEYLDDARAQKLLTEAQDRTDAPGKNVVLGDLVNVAAKGKAPVWKRHVRLCPDHPASAFRAYPSLEAGVRAHLSLLTETFAAAWGWLLVGERRKFCVALSERHYFTDAIDHYDGEIGRLLDETAGMEIDLSPPPADPTGALAAVQSDSLRDLSWETLK